jgi:HlyD family secretion protein
MKKALAIGAGVIVIGVIVYFSIFNPRGKSGAEVYLVKVESGEVVSVVSANGEIQPRTKVNISSNIPGEIVAIPVKEGDRVSKGQQLVRIDQERHVQEVRSREASLRMAQISVEQEQTRNRTLESQLRRAEALRKEGVLPEEDYEGTLLTYESSKIQLKSLEEAVAQTEASLEKAQDELQKTVIYAPMDGKVTQLNTEVGEQVIVGTTNIPGSVIMVISDMSEVLAEADVDETEVVSVRIDQPVKVDVDAIEDEVFVGRVSEIRNSARRKQDVNVFGVKVLLEKPDLRLRPGMSARARIEIDRREGVLRIPIQAVQEKTEKELREEIAKANGESKRRRGKKEKKAPAVDEDEAQPDDTETADGTLAAALEEGDEPAAGSGEAGDAPVAGEEAALPGEAEEAMNDGAEAEPDPAAEDEGSETPKGKDDETVDVVYVFRDGKAEAVRVETGLADDTNVEILAGIEDGDLVITGPYRELRRLEHGDDVVEKEEEGFEAGEGEEGDEEAEEE